MRCALSLGLLCGSIVAAPLPALAQQGERPAVVEEPRGTPLAESAPKEHFSEALVQYRAGRYRAAAHELRAALALDPKSKDLVYNLALVHEKLGELEQAISAWQQYLLLEPDPSELERAQQAITRLQGARAELLLERGPRPATGSGATTPERPAPPPRPSSTAWDGWLLASSGLAAIAGVAGVVFGVRALVLQPGPGAKTSGSRSIDAIHRDQERAERSALVADLSFAISLGAGATAAGLWFAREARFTAPTRAGAVPLAVSWRGRF